MHTIEADYLVIGAGAMGMAFADTLLTETDATVVIVDKHARPGGHWNDSYPFVRLHQPSSFYGVNSRPLGADTKDVVGWNAGLYELASGTEVVTYFEQVMQQQFLPSGRVQYFPMCEYRGDGRVVSPVSGDEFEVAPARRTVDATYMNVRVPSIVGPAYDVADGVKCVALNELPKTETPPDGFVVVGGGKTAMDACLWLLAQGVDPAAIRWIMPRDSWLLDRANIQPSAEFFDNSVGSTATQLEAIAASDSIDDMFARLEQAGVLSRLDHSVRPTMYRCATVTQAELEQLRRIEGVVRLGRVQRIGPNEIVLDDGSIPTTPNTMHVDCTGDALERRPVLPVFDGDRITLQTVRSCQQVFSAAFIGHVEAAYDDDALKNELATVVQHPDTDIDYLRLNVANNMNTGRWSQDADLQAWLHGARLDAFSAFRADGADLPNYDETLTRILTAVMPALEKLQIHLATVGDI